MCIVSQAAQEEGERAICRMAASAQISACARAATFRPHVPLEATVVAVHRGRYSVAYMPNIQPRCFRKVPWTGIGSGYIQYQARARRSREDVHLAVSKAVSSVFGEVLSTQVCSEVLIHFLLFNFDPTRLQH